MSIRRSLVYSYLDRYASLALTIGSSMVIARLLTPADIGVFSVTTVLLMFAATVRDMGAGGYLVQEKELTTDRIRAVWAVQLGLGLLLALVILVASFPAAAFYNEPRMQGIMMVVALNYAINPFGSLTYAWQIREMQFNLVALIRFVSTLGGVVVSLTLAWRGWGPLSLALGTLGATLINAAMAAYCRPKHFPWMPSLKEVRRVLAYGTQTTGASILQTIGANASELFLGKLQGMTATGLFSRANGLIAMFDRLVLSAISSVAIPWFAKQSREQGDISPAFLQATSYVSAVGWAFSSGIALLAFPAIRLLYGDQWDASVDVTRVLALALAMTVPAAMCVAALMAVGAVKEVFRVTLVTTVLSIVLSAIGAYLGMLALGVCFVVLALIRTVFWLRAAQKFIGFKWASLASRLAESAAVGVASGVGPGVAFAVYGPAPASIWAPLAIGVPGAALGFVVSILVLKHPLASELQAIRWPRRAVKSP